jgi:hypothetical protein
MLNASQSEWPSSATAMTSANMNPSRQASNAVEDDNIVYKPVLCFAAHNGHTHELEWALSNSMDLSSVCLALLYRAAESGQVAG